MSASIISTHCLCLTCFFLEPCDLLYDGPIPNTHKPTVYENLLKYLIIFFLVLTLTFRCALRTQRRRVPGCQLPRSRGSGPAQHRDSHRLPRGTRTRGHRLLQSRGLENITVNTRRGHENNQTFQKNCLIRKDSIHFLKLHS